MIVLKFGGTSVQNAEMMDATLAIIERQIDRAPVLVSSAMAKVTDQLQEIARLVGAGSEAEAEAILAAVLERHLACARSFITGKNLAQCEADLNAVCSELHAFIKALAMLKEWSKRSNDAILSFGERLATIILFHRARERGMQAELFDSRELVKTDDSFTSAVPIEDLTNRLISSRVRPQPGTLAIMQGFIASTSGGATTTLGRGGSDYTATIVGAAAHADQHGFGLVVERMGGEDMRGFCFARRVGEQAVARRARGSLQAGLRLGSGPTQNAVRQPKLARKASDRRRLAPGFHAQAVIEGDGEQRRFDFKRLAPARRQHHERGGIRSAGNRQHQCRQMFEIGEKRLEFRCRNWRGLSSAHASVPARRRALRSPMRAEICARPRPAWRRRLPSD